MKLTETNGFKQWCIIELFGHQIIAGMTSEQQIGGQAFVRVDVPALDGKQPQTKFFGSGAIYAITPTDEETCKAAIVQMNQEPVWLWRLKDTLPALPKHSDDYEGEDDDPV